MGRGSATLSESRRSLFVSQQSRQNLLAQLIDNYWVCNCHACYYLLPPIDALQLERMLIRSQRQIEPGLLLRELQFLRGFVCLPVCQFVVCYLFICRLHEADKQSALIANDFKLPAYCKIHICLVRAPLPIPPVLPTRLYRCHAQSACNFHGNSA